MSEEIEFLDTMKRVVLEAENLIERLEEDKDSNLRWIVEKDSLLESLQEARDLLWPNKEAYQDAVADDIITKVLKEDHISTRLSDENTESLSDESSFGY
jgi:hypothetical protein